MTPLVPAEVDLTDFKFMPLDCVRLRDSDLTANVSGDEFRCAVLLWCASWHQLPAASLPNDDKVLSNFAGFGRVVKEWLKVKQGAMRGWVLCDDGRLYHPVVAEKALDAWRSKMEQRWKTECSRIKKHNQRHNIALHVPEFDEWMSLGRPQGNPLPVPEDIPPVSSGHPPTVPRTRRRKARDVPEETHSKGQGRDREGISITPLTPRGGAAGRFDRFWSAYPSKVGKDAARKAFEKRTPDDALLARMLAAIEAQRGSPKWAKDGGQFIPNPATWLNQARWEDGVDGDGSPDVSPWHETRGGVDKVALELGMGTWDGIEQWDFFRARVVRASRLASKEVACS